MGNKKRRFADDGWALWIDGDDRSTIYLNEWINPKGTSYVDVSVRVYGAKEAKGVNFFVPFAIEENEIKDLITSHADFFEDCTTTEDFLILVQFLLS